MTALSTEHFVLQTAANATVSDAAARSSLYVFSLSSALVAMGFASQSHDFFVPFMAVVLSGLFVLGLFTIARLVESVLENMRFLAQIARIRARYRELTPEAAQFFAAHLGRWPEGKDEPALSGPLIGFITTTASMISFINSVIGGTGVALLIGYLFPSRAGSVSLFLGAAVAVLLMGMFLFYQQRRTKNFLAGLRISTGVARK